MDRKILHNMEGVPFNERETFNNAILLLSMVKSEYYYIVGFSRPDNKIEIGFDFEDVLFGQISETVIMDFSSTLNEIKVTTQLTNMVFEGESTIPFLHKENFKINNGCVIYERLFEKNKVFPTSMDKLNSMILSIKKDIYDFMNQSVAYIIKRNRKEK